MAKRVELYSLLIVTSPDEVDFSWRVGVYVGERGPCLATLGPPLWRRPYQSRAGAARAARRVMKCLGIQTMENVRKE